VEPSAPQTDQRVFGRYLRRIREERRLSLDAVEEMSFGYPERITKSHLSRIENGQATPSFPRMFALSQIYGVPISRLAEQFETELHRGMVPDEVRARSPRELLAEIERNRLAGRYREALCLAQAALDRAASDREHPVDGETLTAVTLHQVNCLIHLERYESAKTECELLLSDPRLTDLDRCYAMLQFVIACYRLKRYTIASLGQRRAGELYREGIHPPVLGADIEANGAAVALALGQVDEAVRSYETALAMYRKIPAPFEACRAQVNLGNVLLERGDIKVAAHHLRAALEVADKAGYDRLRAHALSHLAVLAHRGEDLDRTEAYALRSNAIARPREYTSLIFRNCYYLKWCAERRGDGVALKSNERALKTYLSRVEPDLPEAVAYRAGLTGGQS
jgi:transcriptional regulator with XRE-family HTH domain